MKIREDKEYRIVTTQSLKSSMSWRVHSWGKSGSPVLFFHGFTGTGEDAEGIASSMGNGHPVIAPDLPGHGGTDCMPEDGEGWVASMMSLMEVLDLTGVHLCGYSMGGRLAMRLALRVPERISTLTLLSCFPGIRDEDSRSERRRWDLAVGADAVRLGAIQFAEHWESLPLLKVYQPGLLSQRVAARRRAQRPEFLRRGLRDFGSGSVAPCWDELPRLKTPVRLIAGEYDLKYRELMEEMTSHVGTLHIVAGAGHCVHLDAPREVARLLEELEDQRS